MKKTPLRRLSVLLLLALGACGPSPEEVSAARARVEQLDVIVRGQEASFRAAVTAAPVGSCDESMLERNVSNQISNYNEGMLANIDRLGPSHLRRARRDLDRVFERLDGDDVDTEDVEYAGRLVSFVPERYADAEYEVAMFATSFTAPVAEDLTFRPGQLQAHAFVWRIADGAVLCATDVSVQSSSVEDVSEGLEDISLRHNLVYRARETALLQLGLGETRGVFLGSPAIQ